MRARKIAAVFRLLAATGGTACRSGEIEGVSWSSPYDTPATDQAAGESGLVELQSVPEDYIVMTW